MTRTGQRRTRSIESVNGDYRTPFHEWRMTPPPDGPELTAEQIATCRLGVIESLRHGCWQVAIACVERARGGQALRATSEQLTALTDGPKLSEPVAAIVARIVETWLTKSSVEAAVSAIKARQRDESFIGQTLSSTSRLDELDLDRETRALVGNGGRIKTLGDLATWLELWARHHGLMPRNLQRHWWELSRLLSNAGLLGSLATARMNAEGRNSKRRKETA